MVIRIASTVTFLLFFLSSAYADVTKYVDKAGRTHFVDSPDKIPSEYRSQAKDQAPLPPISRSKPGREQLYENERYENKPIAAPKIEIFVTEWCPYCRKLEAFLKSEKLTYLRHDVEKSAKGRMMYEELGGGGIPVVVIGGKVLRGFEPDQIRSAIAQSN